MVNNNEGIYRNDWGFKAIETDWYFANRNGLIKNRDYYNRYENDYIEVEDISLCREFDETAQELRDKLTILLTDRVYFEYDLDNTVVLTFIEAILEEWFDKDEWWDVSELGESIKSGKYDDEMKRYYAYLQAESTLENIKLLDFSDEDSIEDSLSINDIYVYGDAIQFRVAGVLDLVFRTDDLEEDVKNLLTMVIKDLEDSGETVNFKRWYLQ